MPPRGPGLLEVRRSGGPPLVNGCGRRTPTRSRRTGAGQRGQRPRRPRGRHHRGVAGHVDHHVEGLTGQERGIPNAVASEPPQPAEKGGVGEAPVGQRDVVAVLAGRLHQGPAQEAGATHHQSFMPGQPRTPGGGTGGAVQLLRAALQLGRSMPTLHIGTAPHPVLGQPVVHFSGVEPYEVADLEVWDTPLSYKTPDVAYRVVQPLCQRLDVEELWDRPGPHSAGCPAAPVASRLYTPAPGLGSSVHVSSSAFDSSTFCLKGPHWR